VNSIQSIPGKPVSAVHRRSRTVVVSSEGWRKANNDQSDRQNESFGNHGNSPCAPVKTDEVQ
jgi:hypothetical protein